MPTPQPDTRSERRKALDEQLAAEPMLPIPDAAPGDQPRPLESYLCPRRRPVAVVGVVENGVIRLLDAGVKFPEQSRVIVVAPDPGYSQPGGGRTAEASAAEVTMNVKGEPRGRGGARTLKRIVSRFGY